MAEVTRFEVLEEKTHYPEIQGEEKHQNSDESTEEIVETIHEKLAQLSMGETDVKRSSSAKELGNKYVCAFLRASLGFIHTMFL
jgi:hypothetical protein